jgi:hypothetical protein
MRPAGRRPRLRRDGARGAARGRGRGVWSHGRRADAIGDRATRILPDGSADLVLGLARVRPQATAPLALARVWVVGTMTGARLVRAGAFDAHVGVRLRPEAAGRVLGVAAHALVDEQRAAGRAVARCGGAARRARTVYTTSPRPGAQVAAALVRASPRSRRPPTWRTRCTRSRRAAGACASTR